MKKNWIPRLYGFHWDFGFDFFQHDVKKLKLTKIYGLNTYDNF
jgi:hypothetical protein